MSLSLLYVFFYHVMNFLYMLRKNVGLEIDFVQLYFNLTFFV